MDIVLYRTCTVSGAMNKGLYKYRLVQFWGTSEIKLGTYQIRAGGIGCYFFISTHRHFKLTNVSELNRLFSPPNLNPGTGTEDATLISLGTKDGDIYLIPIKKSSAALSLINKVFNSILYNLHPLWLIVYSWLSCELKTWSFWPLDWVNADWVNAECVSSYT